MDAPRWLSTVFQPALEPESLPYRNDAALLRGQLAALHDCGVLDDAVDFEALRRRETAVERGPDRRSTTGWRARRPRAGLAEGGADVSAGSGVARR